MLIGQPIRGSFSIFKSWHHTHLMIMNISKHSLHILIQNHLMMIFSNSWHKPTQIIMHSCSKWMVKLVVIMNPHFTKVCSLYPTVRGFVHRAPIDNLGITNGADWYQVPGGMEDYNYLYGDCFEITIELTCCKYPEASKLKDEWENNKNALWEYTMAAYQESARNHFFRSDELSGLLRPSDFEHYIRVSMDS